MTDDARDKDATPDPEASRPPTGHDDPTVPYQPHETDEGSARGRTPQTDPEAETVAHDPNGPPDDQKPGATQPLIPGLTSGSPESIPGYRIMGQIGRGGMGTVFQAQRLDDRFQKRVAVKVMRRGLDTDELLERFKLERQVLGALNHPNIARLYDAGATEDGRPYFVMEHIDGVPIDVYCDQHSLSIPERVRLFTKVCGAVHYAHQNLIVHRDLKPSNILVTNDGEPKLLDFGIAKLLNPELLGLPALTRPDQRIMTYEYASPEQVQGLQITTASDVYALGVILYELLTGHRPYHIERRVHAEAVRIICEEEPRRPSTAVSSAATRHTGSGEMETVTANEIAKRREAQSTRLRKRLTGDLDNVILMSMRKSAQKRYPTAQALSDDLVRHLDGQTVTARAPTFSYRAGKFLRRHRVAVSTAAIVAVALLVGMAGMTWAWQRAETAKDNETIAKISAQEAEAAERQARDAAETRYSQLRRMFVIEDTLYDEIENLPAATAAREVLASAMLDAIESLAQTFPGDARLQRDLAEQYLRVGILAARGQNSADLGVRALTRAQELLAGMPDTDESKLRVGVELAEAYRQLGDRDAALAAAQRTINRCTAIEADPNAPPSRKTIHADALIQSALVHLFRARFDDAEAELSAAAGLADEALAHAAASSHDNPDAMRSLAHAHEQLGVLADKRGDAETELSELRIALDLRRKVVDHLPDDAEAAHRLVMAIERTGRALMDLRRHGDAEPYFEEMRSLAEAATTDDPFSGRALADFARAFENAADLATKTGNPAQAAIYAEAFRETAQSWLNADPLNLHARRMVGLAHYKHARARYTEANTFRRTDPDRAADLFSQSVPDFESAITELTIASDRDPGDTELIEDLFRATYWLGYAHWRLGEADAQRNALNRCLAEAERRADIDAFPSHYHSAVASVASKLADLEYDAADAEAMINAIDRAVALTSNKTTMLYAQHARALSLQQNFAEAIAMLDAAIEPLEAAETLNASSTRLLDRVRALRADYAAKLATGDLEPDGP